MDLHNAAANYFCLTGAAARPSVVADAVPSRTTKERPLGTAALRGRTREDLGSWVIGVPGRLASPSCEGTSGRSELLVEAHGLSSPSRLMAAIGSAYCLRIEERELSDWGCFVFFRLYGGVYSTPPSDRIHTHRL